MFTSERANSDLTVEEIRASHNRFYNFFFRLVSNPWFNFAIYLFIFASTLPLALYTYDQSEREREVIKMSDLAFTIIFILELICKLIGLGVRNYFKSYFNRLDFLVVLISVVDLILFNTVISSEDSNLFIKSLKALRLFRTLRLARIWRQFRSILHHIWQSMRDVSVFTLLLAVLVFIFAMLGMEIFAHSVYLNADGDLIIGIHQVQEAYEKDEHIYAPLHNFNRIGKSLVCVFALVIGDSWPAKVAEYVRAGQEEYGTAGEVVACTYFVLVMLTGHIIMMALVTALLLKNFEKSLGNEL